MTQLEIPLAAVSEAARAARDAEATVALNGAPSVRLDRRLLEVVDVLVVNEAEAAALAERQPGGTEETIAAVRAIVDSGACCAVATLGAEGAVLVDDLKTDCGVISLLLLDGPVAQVQPGKVTMITIPMPAERVHRRTPSTSGARALAGRS